MTGPFPDQAVSVSFELFPPKTEKAEAALPAVVDRLTAVRPEYFSVTYGAGGSTREGTSRMVEMVRERTGLPVAHHLTCIGARRDEIDAQAKDLYARGIDKIVALRGDLPDGYEVPADGYRDAAELTEGLRRVADFDVSVAGYPEVHPEAADEQADLDHLKRKVDAGASRVILQFAFDTDQILYFTDRARAAGIDVPIVPGIMPVSNFKGLKRFAKMCGANIPQWAHETFEGLDDAPEKRTRVATRVAAEQCRRLIDADLTQFHFYTLNRSDVSLAVCRELGLRLETGDAA